MCTFFTSLVQLTIQPLKKEFVFFLRALVKKDCSVTALAFLGKHFYMQVF